MRLLSLLTFFVAFLAPLASAIKLLESNALNVCMESSNFTATYFNVVFYPGNNSLTIGFDGVSYISGKVEAEMTLTAYGYKAYSSTIDPCSIEGMGMCPMAPVPLIWAQFRSRFPRALLPMFQVSRIIEMYQGDVSANRRRS